MRMKKRKFILHAEPEQTNVRANIPVPMVHTKIDSNIQRVYTRIQLTQFPININDACAVHKLQERSIDDLFVST